MPKIKTNRGAAKRFRTSGSGKVLRQYAYKSHKLTHKSQKRKRKLRRTVVVDSTNLKQVKRMLPYI